MSPKNNSPKPQRFILIDTCIFEHLDIPDLYSQIIFLLRDAVSKGYGLSLAHYTYFELIDTATVENEGKAASATGGLKRFKINHTILTIAGHLGSLYHEDGIDGKRQKPPDSGDKIIGAHAVKENAIIFTTNGRDFPRPFFRTMSSPLLKYTKTDGREVCLVSYFLEPVQDVLVEKYAARMAEHEKKEKKKQEEIKRKEDELVLKPADENR